MDETTQEQFAQTIKKRLQKAQKSENFIVLFLDPMHQIHNNENAYAWQFKGKKGTKQVLSNTGRRRLNIIGAINAISFEPSILLLEGICDQEVIMEFLSQIRKQYPLPKKILIFLDNARYNRAYNVQNKAKKLGIKLMYLPPYSPNLNLIERLWKFFKKKIMKNKYYPTFEIFYQHIEHFFIHFHSFDKEIKTLLTHNFEIIKAS